MQPIGLGLSRAGAGRRGRKGEERMRTVTFHVPGKPQGKARARTFRSPGTGKIVSMTPDRTVLYENLIKDQYLNECKGMYLERGTPAALRIVARFLPPKSASKKRQGEMLEGREPAAEKAGYGQHREGGGGCPERRGLP